MKIFVDTNVFLDLLLKRENYKEALAVLNYIAEGRYEAVILDITILNIDYIAKKQTTDIREFLTIINQTFEVVGATNIQIQKALEISNSDLEDNLQYICAKESNCDIILSNDKNFYSLDIKILTTLDFIKLFAPL